MIQKEIEKQGIRTASVMHLLKVAQKVISPRIMHIKFPLGRSFGKANNITLQKKILKEVLEFALTGEPESIVELPYTWE